MQQIVNNRYSLCQCGQPACRLPPTAPAKIKKAYRKMNLGLPEILLITLVVLLLFGGKKIPELMKGLGKGVKSFKDGLNGLEDKENENSNVKSEK